MMSNNITIILLVAAAFFQGTAADCTPDGESCRYSDCCSKSFCNTYLRCAIRPPCTEDGKSCKWPNYCCGTSLCVNERCQPSTLITITATPTTIKTTPIKPCNNPITITTTPTTITTTPTTVTTAPTTIETIPTTVITTPGPCSYNGSCKVNADCCDKGFCIPYVANSVITHKCERRCADATWMCDADDQCCGKLKCYKHQCKMEGCFSIDNLCKADRECCDGPCIFRRCRLCNGITKNLKCTRQSQCCDGFYCSEKRVCTKIDEPK